WGEYSIAEQRALRGRRNAAKGSGGKRVASSCRTARKPRLRRGGQCRAYGAPDSPVQAQPLRAGLNCDAPAALVILRAQQCCAPTKRRRNGPPEKTDPTKHKIRPARCRRYEMGEVG